jgi:hypothetical protein
MILWKYVQSVSDDSERFISVQYIMTAQEAGIA